MLDTRWEKVADIQALKKTAKALKAHGIDAYVVPSGSAAKEKLFSFLPEGASVMNMTSVTLDTIGVTQQVLESGKYNAIKKQLTSMDREKDSQRMRELGAAPEYAVGSVHAVTEEGSVLIASNTGSQLPAYVYGAGYVVFVIGGQKVVKNTDEGIKRIYEHSLPLESKRAKKVYGVSGSFVSKLLIINKENIPHRISAILVHEKLGF